MQAEQVRRWIAPDGLSYAGLWRVLARDSGGGRARGALRVWDMWERLSEWIWPVQPIPGSRAGLLRIRAARYRGPLMRLEDGTALRRGTAVVHLHLNNVLVAQTALDTPWELYHLALKDLRALASWVGQIPEPERPVALVAKTLLGHATHRLGFTCVPSRRTPYLPFFRLYVHGLMIMYGREGWRRMRRGHVRAATCYDIGISTREFLRRYGPPSSDSPERLTEDC